MTNKFNDRSKLIDFLKWIKSDNVIKIGDDQYIEQTTQYEKIFSRDELFFFFKNTFKNSAN